MVRRKTFDPTSVPPTFWRRDDVRLALARREIGQLFTIYLQTHNGCTQTQLALITEHDRSDISNFVRGIRSPRVADIDVLGRVAEGLAIPDEARVLLGLAPLDIPLSAITTARPAGQALTPEPVTTGWYQPDNGPTLRLALCGSRSPGVNDLAVDEAIVALSQLLMNRPCQVDHGPMGIGIETMTYIADHYRPPDLHAAVGIFGRQNVVRNATYVLVIGGGAGTQDEIDLAISMNKKIIPYAISGGTARRTLHRMTTTPALRSWLSDTDLTALTDCARGHEYTKLVDSLMETADHGRSHR